MSTLPSRYVALPKSVHSLAKRQAPPNSIPQIQPSPTFAFVISASPSGFVFPVGTRTIWSWISV